MDIWGKEILKSEQVGKETKEYIPENLEESKTKIVPVENVKTEKTKETKALEPRKIVKICNPGTDHVRHNINNHDFAFSFMNIKAVTDGCGSGKHSEVGTKLFGQLFAREVSTFINCFNNKSRMQLLKYVKRKRINELAKYVERGEIPEEAFLGIVNEVFERMLSICSEPSYIFENYCFTILVCFEYKDEYVVYSCGDGFIIKENTDGITFEQLDDGEFPAYYVYNWIDSANLKEYKEGVEFKVKRFKKSEYTNIGVASDGLRFFEDLYEPEKYKFKANLSEGKGPQIEMLITRNNRKEGTFKDDISICF